MRQTRHMRPSLIRLVDFSGGTEFHDALSSTRGIVRAIASLAYVTDDGIWAPAEPTAHLDFVSSDNQDVLTAALTAEPPYCTLPAILSAAAQGSLLSSDAARTFPSPASPGGLPPRETASQRPACSSTDAMAGQDASSEPSATAWADRHWSLRRGGWCRRASRPYSPHASTALCSNGADAVSAQSNGQQTPLRKQRTAMPG